jgi:ring-1,2-phenylacetyl-CoA epoxidase subunit PaaD
MTPTYSGCPALEVMRSEVEQALSDRGYSPIEISYQYDPPWTSDWIDSDTREALRAAGIAPPAMTGEQLVQIGTDTFVKCPFCSSNTTELRCEFGSTACKSMHYCLSCLQPFERFKTSRG